MKKYKVLCPLNNFQVQTAFMIPKGMSDEEVRKVLIEQNTRVIDGIELFNGVKLRRISNEDLEDFKNYPFPLWEGTSISSGMFVLERIITDEDEGYSEIHKTMVNIVLGLRLLKKGDVVGNAVYSILLLPDQRTLVSSYLEEESIPQTFRSPYVLKFDDIPALKALLVKILEIDFVKKENLHLACKRLQRTYGESDSEDKLIDLMIGFEALFLKGEKVGTSSGQIVAIACSHLLGKNDEERDKIRHFLTKAYKIRNSIVHGSGYKPTIKDNLIVNDLYEIVSEAEDYLRESIKRLLD
jgi:hypothetical protein